MNLTDDLWGGVLRAFAVDIAAHRLTLSIDTITNGAQKSHEAIFAGVLSVQFVDVMADPWDYVEVTAVRVGTAERGSIRVELDLWSEDSRLMVVCAALTVDGTVVSPI